MSRLLIVDDQPPQGTRDGASKRMLTLLELLTTEGHSVDFGSARGWPDGLDVPVRRLRELGVGLVGQAEPVDELIAREAKGYDVVVLSRLTTCQRLFELVRASAPGVRVIYDAMDVAHLTTYRRAKAAGNAALLRRALAEQRQERRMATSVDAIIAVSEEEAGLFRKWGARCPIGVATAVDGGPVGDPAPRAGRQGGLFVGYFGSLDNELAARRLVQRVWPLVLRRCGPQPLLIVGAAPPSWLTELGDRESWLAVAGAVPNIDPLLRGAAVTVAPIDGGAGIKTKVLQSLAWGIPVVATTAALRGIPAIHREHAIRADSDAGLAAGTAEVLGDAALWQRLSSSGARLHTEHFGRRSALVGLRTALGMASSA